MLAIGGEKNFEIFFLFFEEVVCLILHLAGKRFSDAPNVVVADRHGRQTRFNDYTRIDGVLGGSFDNFGINLRNFVCFDF